MLRLSKSLRALKAALTLLLTVAPAAWAAGSAAEDRGPHVQPYPVYVINGAQATLAGLETNGVSDLAHARHAVRRAVEDTYEVRGAYASKGTPTDYRQRQDAVLARLWHEISHALTHADYTQLRQAIWRSQGTFARFDPSYLAPEGVRARPELDAARTRAISVLVEADRDLSRMFFASEAAMQDFIDERVRRALATLNAPLSQSERERIGVAEARHDTD